MSNKEILGVSTSVPDSTLPRFVGIVLLQNGKIRMVPFTRDKPLTIGEGEKIIEVRVAEIKSQDVEASGGITSIATHVALALKKYNDEVLLNDFKAEAISDGDENIVYWHQGNNLFRLAIRKEARDSIRGLASQARMEFGPNLE